MYIIANLWQDDTMSIILIYAAIIAIVVMKFLELMDHIAERRYWALQEKLQHWRSVWLKQQLDSGKSLDEISQIPRPSWW